MSDVQKMRKHNIGLVLLKIRWNKKVSLKFAMRVTSEKYAES